MKNTMQISPTPFSGRPDTRRTDAEEAIYDALDALGIPFTRVDHDHADTMEDCLLIEKVLGARVPKNLFLTNRQKTAFYLLLMPGDKPFKTKFLSAQLGVARLSFAEEEAMKALLHTIPGSVSPLELVFDGEKRIRFIVDDELKTETDFACHPGLSSSTVRLSRDGLLRYLEASGHEITYVSLPRQIEE